MARIRSEIRKPKASRRTLMREEIIKKAAALFEQYGYRAVSVDNIVDDVGISKPTFYSHVESKDEVLWQIYETIGVEARKFARAALTSEGDPADRLRRLIRSHLEHIALRRDFYAVYFQEEAALPKKLQTKFKASQYEYQKMVEELLQQGIQQGLFPNADPKIAALGLLGMCNWVCKWYKPDGGFRPSEIADQFFAMVTGQVQNRPAQNSY